MDENKLLDWDSEIENDSQYTTLPEGDYPFIVSGFERSNYEGSEKVPPCLMAKLTLTVTAPNGETTNITERLYLARVMEWKLCEFFTSIGQRKHGEKLKPNWQQVKGSRGICSLTINKYRDKDGIERENNRVQKYLPKEDTVPAQASWKNGGGF